MRENDGWRLRALCISNVSTRIVTQSVNAVAVAKRFG
jgi:hypothetical protein